MSRVVTSTLAESRDVMGCTVISRDKKIHTVTTRDHNFNPKEHYFTVTYRYKLSHGVTTLFEFKNENFIKMYLKIIFYI